MLLAVMQLKTTLQAKMQWAAILPQADCSSGKSLTLLIQLNEQDKGSSWREVHPQGPLPIPRGWFAAAGMSDGMIIHGGNAPDNSRLADLHRLQF